ncbi:hypothetical protein D3C78_1031760 [compost metagenome]
MHTGRHRRFSRARTEQFPVDRQRTAIQCSDMQAFDHENDVFADLGFADIANHFMLISKALYVQTVPTQEQLIAAAHVCIRSNTDNDLAQ